MFILYFITKRQRSIPPFWTSSMELAGGDALVATGRPSGYRSPPLFRSSVFRFFIFVE